MLADFIPEVLTDIYDIVVRRGFARNVVFDVPEPHVIEEGKSGEFPNRAPRDTVISAEVNCAGENAFKSVDEPMIVLSITRQTEFFEHFRTGMKPHASTLLPYGERGNPDWNQPVLPKGESEIGVSLDLKNEFPVSPRVQKCAFWWPSKRKTAQHERTRGKDQVL
jgi:hypothetical protein